MWRQFFILAVLLIFKLYHSLGYQESTYSPDKSNFDSLLRWSSVVDFIDEDSMGSAVHTISNLPRIMVRGIRGSRFTIVAENIPLFVVSEDRLEIAMFISVDPLAATTDTKFDTSAYRILPISSFRVTPNFADPRFVSLQLLLQLGDNIVPLESPTSTSAATVAAGTAVRIVARFLVDKTSIPPTLHSKLPFMQTEFPIHPTVDPTLDRRSAAIGTHSSRDVFINVTYHPRIDDMEYEDRIFSAAVDISLDRAERRSTKLPPHLLNTLVPGIAFRIFMNSLAKLRSIRYLEVGVFDGRTLLSVLYNFGVTAVAIDSWDSFEDMDKAALITIRDRLVKSLSSISEEQENDVFIIHDNCWRVSAAQVKESLGGQLVNLYFYDGPRGEADMFLSLQQFYTALDDLFVFVVSGWNSPSVRLAVAGSISMVNVEVVSSVFITTADTGNIDWMDGFGVFVLRKGL